MLIGEGKVVETGQALWLPCTRMRFPLSQMSTPSFYTHYRGSARASGVLSLHDPLHDPLLWLEKLDKTKKRRWRGYNDLCRTSHRVTQAAWYKIAIGWLKDHVFFFSGFQHLARTRAQS